MTHKKICFVAGGSGGHIIPCITMAYQTRLTEPETSFMIFTGNTELELAIIKASTTPIQHFKLRFKAPPYSRFYWLPVWFTTFFAAIIKSFSLLIRHKPTEIITTGSHIALPVCIAAWFLRIPITVYELNVEPGKTTSFLAPFATTIKVHFPSTCAAFSKKKCILAPYPVKFTEKDKQHDTAFLREKLGIAPSKKVVLVLGGSQGSIFLNSIMPHMFSTHPALKEVVHVVHQTGAVDPTDWRHWYYDRGISAHVFAYSNEILMWYLIADLIMCRSGAGTLAEAVFFEKPCITIPLETKSTNHQLANALAYQELYPETLKVIRQGETAQAERALIALLSLEAYASPKTGI
jgi:UDP-N-acetylglucosamine--N-acetylmuramyl-(pentapeptide) pyrophosphoryl-undecaprenol N-acetylglucosamine transferase